MNLTEKMNTEVTSWPPKEKAKGDIIIGTVLDMSERESEFGPYPVVQIETPAGELVDILCFGTVLKGELEKKQPRIGDDIGVRYDGKPAGKTYDLWRLEVERHPERYVEPVTPVATVPAPVGEATQQKIGEPGGTVTEQVPAALAGMVEPDTFQNEPF